MSKYIFFIILFLRFSDILQLLCYLADKGDLSEIIIDTHRIDKLFVLFHEVSSKCDQIFLRYKMI